MAAFSTNPLFRRASKRVQREARAQWKKTTAAKSVAQVRSALSAGKQGAAGGAIGKAINQWSKAGWTDLVRSSLSSSDFGSMVREVERYARMSGSTGRLVSEFLGSMGPIGSLIRSVISSRGSGRKSGVGGDIQAAIDFLDAVAPESLSGRGRKRSTLHKPASRRTASEVAAQIDAAKQFLETQGFEVKPQEGKLVGGEPIPPGAVMPGDPTPESQATYPGGVPKTTGRGTPRKVVDVDIQGTGRRFPVNHPIVTKRMVLTPQSSNVFSYSYDVDTWTLYVRFQSHMVVGVPGSLYGYSSVPPDVFLKMYAAPSKGTFIWDNIRIRGTVSGHRYDYQLVGIRNNYVPRKATMTAEGERYVQRTVKVKSVSTGKIRVLRSGGDMQPAPSHYR